MCYYLNVQFQGQRVMDWLKPTSPLFLTSFLSEVPNMHGRFWHPLSKPSYAYMPDVNTFHVQTHFVSQFRVAVNTQFRGMQVKKRGSITVPNLYISCNKIFVA